MAMQLKTTPEAYPAENSLLQLIDAAVMLDPLLGRAAC
jgi:hypothetical protein